MTVRRALFLFWGRRGPVSRLALDIACLDPADVGAALTVSVSRTNDQFAAFAGNERVLPVTTFSRNSGALTEIWRLPALRRQLAAHVRSTGTDLVVNLMPHVWTPFIIPVVRAAGVPYVAVVHDADVHPGDYRTRVAKPLLDLELRRADQVLALSQHVAARVGALGLAPPERIRVAFLPVPGAPAAEDGKPRRSLPTDRPFRLLFLGRIMPYKGLDLFVEAMGLLRQRGRSIEIAVCGEGDPGPNAAGLIRLGARFDNRWLSDADVAAIIERSDALVLSHREASQSGLIPLAHAAGLPVVATPVGGLVEQIDANRTGIIAAAATPAALADAVDRLIAEPGLYARVTGGIAAAGPERSVATFVRACLAAGGGRS